ncbi:glycosyltransferase family 4 protein [Limnobacter humi]|uniref:Glycosyltransferase family 4 protein n=1 Tax=Limnobacter humi TaxID=1778671 RepID=A0ABT1WLG7_9BURK|nr:glycosyltransferase family 1 protein [Limnobacter humi]MCQ8897729.1 glycosyltransferase family 4 protein [Limnobacter humi]
MMVFDGIVFSLQRYGGISVYFNALVSQLAAGPQPCELLLANQGLVGKPADALKPHYSFYSPRLLERYRDVSATGELFHSSYYRLPNHRSIRSVVTVYDFTYERYFPFKQRLVHSWQKFRAIRAADAVLCISESTRRDLLTYLPDVNPAKVKVTHLAANPVFFDDAPFDGPSPLPVQADSAGYVLFVGARSTYKNFMPLVHALNGSHLHLVCVGGGDFTDPEKLACEQHLAGRYHHLSWADEHTLRQLYREAVCLVFPSLYEGFGIPVVEAMAAGCPVIASNVSSIPEVAGQAGILLDSVTADHLRQAIRDVQDTARRADMVQLGKQHAAQFTWAACANATLEAYQSLCAYR